MQRHMLYRKILIVTGMAIMACPRGLNIYWGNVTVYVNSYFLSCLEPVPLSPWVISVFNITRFVSLFVFAAFNNGGRPWIPVVGMLLSVLGVFLTYFSVQSSMLGVIVTMGVIFGLGSGILNAWMATVVVDYFAKNIAFMNSVVGASINCGAMLINEFVTQYINPLNQQPNLDFAGSKYFTQKDIVDRVPATFLIFGGIVITVQVLGFCLLNIALRVPWNYAHQAEEQRSGTVKSCESDKDSYNVREEASTLQSNKHNSVRGSTTNLCRQENPNALCQSEVLQLSHPKKEFTPKEVLKSQTFYVIWISFFFADFLFLLVNNFYKVFGQLQIDDDHFLTFTGTARTFCDIWGRLVWGAVMDRIGVKNSWMIVMGLAVMTSFWYYFTPLVNRWLYFACTILFGNFAAAFTASYLPLSVVTFGRTNVSSNMALIRSSAIASNLLAPLLFETLLLHTSWFYTFVISGVVNVFSVTFIKFSL